jgi:spore germination cell wall hydrolase CwlJ-like protein
LLATACAGLTIAAAAAWTERARERASAARAADLECLARNVYYESRGEPLVGQYAVAEVTMNRVASSLFPESVCAVVHAPAAFSWTRAKSLAEPDGYEWWRAQAVANSVYDDYESPYVDGALFFHATYVSPRWARTRRPVAQIGRHRFYQ